MINFNTYFLIGICFFCVYIFFILNIVDFIGHSHFIATCMIGLEVNVIPGNVFVLVLLCLLFVID